MQFIWTVVVGKIVHVSEIEAKSASVVVYAPATSHMSNLYFDDLTTFLEEYPGIEPPQPTDAIWRWRFWYTDRVPRVGDHCLVTDSAWETLPISYTVNECYKTYLTDMYNYGDLLVPYTYTKIPASKRDRRLKAETLWLDEETGILFGTPISNNINEYGKLIVDTSSVYDK